MTNICNIYFGAKIVVSLLKTKGKGEKSVFRYAKHHDKKKWLLNIGLYSTGKWSYTDFLNVCMHYYIKE